MAEKTPEEIEAERLEAEKKKAADKKVKFDEEQTVVVNSIYNRAFGEGAAKAEAEWKAKLEEERKELAKKAEEEKAELARQLEELRKSAGLKTDDKVVEPPKTPEVKIEEHPLVKQMQAQMEEMRGIFQQTKQERDELKKNDERARAERRKSRKKDMFLNAMKDANVSFFDPLEAYDLAEKDGLEYDEENDRVFVKNSQTGAAKLNSEGEPMGAVDFVKDFATRKKYLVKAPDSSGGTGSGAADKLEKERQQTKDWSKATPEELEAERQRILSKQR